MIATTAAAVKKTLKKFATPARAKVSQSFFKTGPGQYGEGDIFIGVTMPDARVVAKQFRGLPEAEIVKLLHSKIHEERMVALLIIVDAYAHSDALEKQRWHTVYLRERAYINNWDLVDVTTPRVVGAHLIARPRTILYRLVKSKRLWDRRIAVLATFAFIAQNDFADSFALCDRLLSDPHDLMHKACGWMLREIGKRSPRSLLQYLDKNARKMPRTMLRYAIERFPIEVRKKYLAIRKI